MSDRPPVTVHLLPSLIPPGALTGGVAVVLDVLRATSAMIAALAAGCERIVPCLEVEEALRVANEIGRDRAVLGGERQGLPIPGFDFGNSPSSYNPESCGGKVVVITTTNGTKAILASETAETVRIASFANLSATVASVVNDPRPLHVVCAGTDGLVSFEDSLMAGAIVAGVKSARVPANDSALIALWAWLDARTRLDDEGGSLAELLGQGRGGRRVREIGLAADLLDVAKIDRFPLVAELDRGRGGIVRAG